jgi:hypothetical protein
MKKLLIVALLLIWFWWFSLASTQLSEAITRMNQNWLTKFTNATDFMATKGLRRDEATKFFVQYAKETLWLNPDTSKTTCNFTDLSKARPDLKDLIKESCQLGLFQWNNGKFMPTQSLTNAQAITVLIRMIDGKKDENQWHFAQLYFEKAQDLWIMNWLLLNSTANFDKLTTRGDVGILIYNASQLSGTSHQSINQNTSTIPNNSSVKLSDYWNKITEKIHLTAWLHKFRATYNWESNFIAKLLDSNWDYISLLANEIWNTDSSLGVKIEEEWDYYINVDAEWSREITVNYETPRVVVMQSKISGQWTNIIWPFNLTTWLHKFRSIYNWESNFIVKLINSNWDYIDLLANEIWNTDSSLGVSISKSWDYYFNIDADGSWTIEEFK